MKRAVILAFLVLLLVETALAAVDTESRRRCALNAGGNAVAVIKADGTIAAFDRGALTGVYQPTANPAPVVSSDTAYIVNMLIRRHRQ